MQVENARRARAEGLSYADIAASQGVSPTAVYYALNPDRRSEKVGARQRSIYTTDVLWDRVCEVAWADHVSVSSVVEDILAGRRPPVGEEK